MIDLNNFNSGKKLIKKVMEKTNNTKQPWSKEQQVKKAATNKNPNPKK